MNIPTNLFVIVDVIIVVVFVLCITLSYKNGLIYELVNLFLVIIAIVLAYFVSPILAKSFFIIKPDFIDNPLLDLDLINFTVNKVCWFIVLVILFSLIMLLIKPLFKSLTKIPVVGWINKLSGILFGIIKGLFICSLLSCLLKFSFIQNGDDVHDGSILKYTDLFSSKAIKFVVSNINYDDIKNEVEDINIEETREYFEKWLIEQGFIDE